jgi:hypothetical protein
MDDTYKQDDCIHHWSIKQWRIIITNDNGRTTETRDVTKMVCLKCFRIRKVRDNDRGGD